MRTKTKWSNQNNADYYENVPFEVQAGYAVRGGLNTGRDLDLILDYIKGSDSLLEVGAGYGRVIDYLLEYNYQGNITAVERSQKFFQLLKEKYSSSVDLIQKDILHLSLKKSFDVILWLWSGISDFMPKEQIQVLKQLSSHLNPDGYILLDTFTHAQQPLNANSSNKQYYVIEVEKCVLQGYIPSPDEIKTYAKDIGLQFIQHLPYITTTQRPRDLYILKNAI